MSERLVAPRSSDVLPGPVRESAGARTARHRRRGGRAAAAFGSPGGRLGAVLLGSVLLAALLGPLTVGGDPLTSTGPALAPPSATHRFGSDDLGRDVLALVLHGLRTSLLVAAGVVAVAGVIGVAVGALSGWYGGRLDDVAMRLTEMVQIVPRFFLAVVVVALFGPGLLNLVLVLGLTSWTWTARVVRAETLSLRRREFIDAARAAGGSPFRILSRHVWPNILGTTLVMLSVCASSAILIEAGLGFVGLTDPDVVSLGYLANNAQRFLRTAWWLTVFPGAALVLTIVGINLVGDAFGDAAGRLSGRETAGSAVSRAAATVVPRPAEAMVASSTGR